MLYLLDLPIEILFSIIFMLDITDIMTLMNVNSFFYKIINNKDTIYCLCKKLKFRKVHNLKNLLKIYHCKYISIKSLDYMSMDKCLFKSCILGNLDMVKFLLKNNKFNKKKLEVCASRAARKNQVEIVNFFIKKGLTKDFNRIMANAGFCGNINLIDKMLKLGAKGYNYCAWAAARNNQIDIINYMLSLGADNFLDIACGAARGGYLYLIELFMDFSDIENINILMFNAVYGGHINIVKYLINKGANDFNRGLIAASKKGDLEITKLMLEKNANNYFIAFKVALNYENLEILKILPDLSIDYYNSAIAQAIAGNKSLKIISFIFDKGVNNYKYIMNLASFIGSMKTVKILIKKGVNEYNEGLKGASIGGFLNIAKLMLKLKANNVDESMIDSSNVNIVKLLIKKGGNKYEETMYNASRRGYIDIVKLMIEKGAKNFKYCLYNACEFNHLDIVKVLTENFFEETKLQINYKDINYINDLNYCLIMAAREGYYNIVKYLTNIGANKYDLAIISASHSINPSSRHFRIIKFLRSLFLQDLNDIQQ